MNYSDWVPKYIKQSIQDKPRTAIDAVYWNALWNLVITQGDHNASGIEALIEAIKNFDISSISGAVDETFDITSVNPLQNKVITAEVNRLKQQITTIEITTGNIDSLLGTI